VSYALVIVNWNGADDTLACLASVLEGGGHPALTVIVDNASADRSPERIAEGLATRGIGLARAGADAAQWPRGADAVLVAAEENLGFAAGCNLGLRVAVAAGCAQVVFLNNDTVVERGALDKLVLRLEGDSGCFATLPMLTVHGTDRIWNCGGVVHPVLGLRRYFLAGRPRNDGTRRAELRCSFFTGCCFAVRTAAFADRGGFSERFFFGEEDFELALWMHERGLHAVCLTSAVVQHKVSVSFDAAAAVRPGARARPKALVYYLNRFIHMRLRFGTWRWRLWTVAYLPYAAWRLWRNGVLRVAELPGFGGQLLRLARRMDRVSRTDFESVMAGRMPA